MSMANSNHQKLKTKFSPEGFAAGTILLLGIVLRLRQYLTGRSLWLDEAMLALNIVNRDFASLFKPLDYDQGAPIGFLLVEKVLNVLFGDHEFVLRLLPLAAGIVALFLFYLLLRQTTNGIGLLFGLALFAVGPRLIYYSSELKQYMVDVALTIALLLLALPILEGKIDKRDYFFLGLAGLISLWFSHPVLFVLAGIGACLLWEVLKSRNWLRIRKVLILGVIWLANFGLLYSVALQDLSRNTFLLEYWQENFMPMPPWSDWGWFGTVFNGLIQNQIGVYTPAWLILILLVVGFTFLFIKKKIFACVLLTIFILSLIAAGLQLYPLGGRLSLFLVPLLIILLSQSIDWLQTVLKTPYPIGKVIATALGLYLLISPTSEAFQNFINPKYFEHIRPSMATLSENWQEGDTLFVSNGAVPAFRFYADRYGLGDVDYQTSVATDYQNPDDIMHHLQSLDGNSRVWVLITHVYETKDFNEKDFLLSSFDMLGEHKREFKSPGTSVYLNLYDLSQ